MHRISPIPLTVQAFADFGDVVEASPEKMFSINKGTTNRFHDLANINFERGGGSPTVNIFRGTPYPFPLTIRMMENHPLGSQFFMPLDPFDYLVAVAEAKSTVMPEDVLVFSCSHKQGVNFKPGVWHHPLLVLAEQQDFLVIDRAGEGVNLVEQDLVSPIMVDLDEKNPQGRLEPRPRQ